MFINNVHILGVMWGVGVAVVALILLTTREMWQNSKRNWFFHTIFLLALISLLVFKLSPIQTILIFSLIGFLIKSVKKGEVNK
jgi:chromate transport protein ChrA